MSTTTAPPHAPPWTFLGRALTRPRQMGTIAPTSAVLADRIARLVPATPGLRVLELGAGTGAISAAIGRRLGPGAVHVAVERDPLLLAGVGAVAPSAVPVAGDAADLQKHLAASGIDRVDVVVSSLPWTNLDPGTQRRILAATRRALVDDGTFVTVALCPTRLRASSRRFHRLLDATFARVVTSATTWANLPPARLLVAYGRPSGGSGA